MKVFLWICALTCIVAAPFTLVFFDFIPTPFQSTILWHQRASAPHSVCVRQQSAFLIRSSASRMTDYDTTSYLHPTLTESYSIWLMPKPGNLSDRMQQEIDLLQEQHADAPHFPPHVTLIGGVDQPGEKFLEVAEDLAKKVKKFDISLLNVSRGAIFYQCVYMLCAKTEALMKAGTLARELYQAPSNYMPHLSLLYSDIPEAQRDKVVEATRQRFYGEGKGYDTLLTESTFEVDSLHVWYTPFDKSTKSWCEVAEIPLS